MNRKTAGTVYTLLFNHYPHATDPPRTAGRGSPFQVLILTILSAQTTDRAVLAVQRPLFSRYPAPADLAKAEVKDVEEIIHSLGFYHVKAKHVIATARTLIADFGGAVPETMEGLLTLPGVGRKTANIVLYHALGRNEGIAVDTHVRRLARRIGFSRSDNQDRIEQDLMQLYPAKDWGDLTDVLISHGRACCTARNPACDRCPVTGYCRYYRTVISKSGNSDAPSH